MLSKKNKSREAFSLGDFSEEEIRQELFYYIRMGGIKYNSFYVPLEKKFNTAPIYEKMYEWKERYSESSNNTWARYCVDIKEILGYDRAVFLIAILFLKRIANEKKRPDLILALETTGFTLAGAILSLHSLFFPEDKLEACYIRKDKKKYDLARSIEGTRDFSGKRAVFVDDFSNWGKSLRYVFEISKENRIILQKGLFVVREDKDREKTFHPDVPIEGLFTVSQVKDEKLKVNLAGQKYSFEHNVERNEPIVKKESKDPLWQINFLDEAENEVLSREDIELVKLAKDAAVLSVASDHTEKPELRYDGRGSYGYLPFLGKYLQEKNTVAVKINKREFKDGQWINRSRGCSIWGSESNSTAQNLINATVYACKKSLRLNQGNPRGPFHKPIWTGELGSLSFFIFIEEKREWIRKENIRSVKFGENDGLLIREGEFIKVIFDDLEKTVQSESVLPILLSNLANREGELKTFSVKDDVEIIKISGRWIWSPERPKKYYFNHIQ